MLWKPKCRASIEMTLILCCSVYFPSLCDPFMYTFAPRCPKRNSFSVINVCSSFKRIFAQIPEQNIFFGQTNLSKITERKSFSVMYVSFLKPFAVLRTLLHRGSRTEDLFR